MEASWRGARADRRGGRRALPALGLLAWGVLAAACAPGAADPALRVRVTGASTLYPIVVLAGEALRAEGIEVEAQAGGSSRGFEDTVAGRNDLGAMARELTAGEAARVRAFAVARDGVAIVAHASNPVSGLTTEALRRVYRKELVEWRRLGGGEGRIVVVSKAAGHATLESFLAHTGLGRSELALDAVGGDNAQILRLVSTTPGALGYVSLGEALHAVEIGMPLKLLALDGVEPSPAGVADGSYPLHRTLYLISKREPRGASRRLLDFLRGDDGRRVIERGKYVPLAG